jgi:hypothetical protein
VIWISQRVVEFVALLVSSLQGDVIPFDSLGDAIHAAGEVCSDMELAGYKYMLADDSDSDEEGTGLDFPEFLTVSVGL